MTPPTLRPPPIPTSEMSVKNQLFSAKIINLIFEPFPNQIKSNSSPTLRACLIPSQPPLPKPQHNQGDVIANGTWASHSGQTTHLGGEPVRELHSRQSSHPDRPRDARLGFYMVSCVPKTNTSNMN